MVADEVRNLAHRAQESAQQIQKMIEELQIGAQEAVSTMTESQRYSLESVEIANRAGERLSSVTGRIAEIDGMNQSVATATEEQTAVVDSLNMVKREAAALVLDQGYSHIDACRSLGVVDSALRRWVKQLEAERQGVTPKSKALTPEQQKIQELEARINRLEREKAILKKATALLMSDELDRTR